MAKDRIEHRELWEQQDGETSNSFSHFCMYRDMRYPKVTRPVRDSDGNITKEIKTEQVMDGTVPYEKRSLRKLAVMLDVNIRTISRESKACQWVKRAEAYDAFVDRMIREAREAAIKKMVQEHAILAQQMIRKATKRLLTMPDDQISAAELVRMVDVAVRVERLSRGESTDIQAVTHNGEVEVKQNCRMDLTELTNEELDQLEKLFTKASGSGPPGG